MFRLPHRLLTHIRQPQPLNNATSWILLNRALSAKPQEPIPDPVSETSALQATDSDRPDDLYRFLWLKCSAHHTPVLDSYETFIKQAAQHLEVDYVKTEAPWRTIKRRTLLASRFVKKKYRVQYEIRTYYRDLMFKNLTGSTLDTFLEYVERNLPEGVMLIVEKHRLDVLPFELEPNKE